MPNSQIVYVELPSSDIVRSKDFYGPLFGWMFQDYGPDYAAFSNSGVEGGFNAGDHHRTAAPLVVIQTDDLEAMEERVRAAGAAITLPIFAFPGGRRFHFRDPSGNELAVLQPE